ncbi:MAG: hypothetical protein UX17_C0022G0005 [Parcubacteria group bacterium GW2011_GWC2_45_7]|nr:MAG: hypothetical protein UX17_C0022G0005 [Parcubacteria group bacterium GW2011_GWC2_45_7]KKU73507.1 MAG: hypothetical protein UX98_C0006G0005 [Parcubacteria group bacterium GW2011_GWA2_47_26]
MRILGIDYGTKRVGVAIGDTESRVAVPYDTLEFGGATLECLHEIIEREKIDLIIIGLPLTTGGEESKSSVLVRQFIKELKSLGIPVEMQDERFTTKEVEKITRGYGKARKGVDKDAAAAALILQSFLEQI